MSNGLRPEERVRLQQIVAELSEFAHGAERDRRVLMDMTGLGGLASGLDLSGPPRTVAGALVLAAEKHGVLADRPRYHALGALLSYLLTLGDLPREDAAFVARLIVECALVTDPNYVGTLREKYGLAGAVVRPPVPGLEPSSDRPSGRDYSDREYQIHLRDILVTRHSTEDLKLLCFELGAVIPDLDYDSLPGQGKADKARELVAFVGRRGRVADLVEVGRRLRPDIPW